MAKRRPVKRLTEEREHGKGQAQVVEKPGQLSHILWAASKGERGRRNVVVIWMLFGSGLRVNEVAHLKVSDVFHPNGTLKEVFSVPSPYTKTDKGRPSFIVARHQRDALLEWRDQRLREKAFLSEDGSYGGLSGDSPLILGKRGKTWTRLAFNDKKYRTEDGEIATTKVCGSLENLVRDLFKGLAYSTVPVTLGAAHWQRGSIGRGTALTSYSSFWAMSRLI